MTRKDYQAIADKLAEAQAATDGLMPDAQRGYRAGIDWATSSIADVLEADNPRFDRKLFLDAANHGYAGVAVELARSWGEHTCECGHTEKRHNTDKCSSCDA